MTGEKLVGFGNVDDIEGCGDDVEMVWSTSILAIDKESLPDFTEMLFAVQWRCEKWQR